MASIAFRCTFRWGLTLAFLPSVAHSAPGDIWDLQPKNSGGSAAPASAATTGWWGPAITIVSDLDSTDLLNVVHGAVVPYKDTTGVYQEGKLILYKGQQIKIFDLKEDSAAVGEDTIFPLQQYPDFHQLIFCSGHAYLEDGRLLITGGDWGQLVSGEDIDRLPDAASWASIYDPVGRQVDPPDTLIAIDPMPGNPRYYPTSVTHRDGTILTIGGNYWTDLNGDLIEDPNEFINNDTWAEFRPDPGLPSGGTWCEIPNLIPDSLLAYVDLYPHLKVLPEGLLWLGPTHGVATTHSWFWPYTGQGTYGTAELSLRREAKRLAGTAVLLPLDAVSSPTARVLYIGGGNRAGSCSDPCDSSAVCLRYPTNSTEMYDSSLADSLRWRDEDHPTHSYDSDMTYARKEPNAVILPTGDVLVVGGYRWHDHAAGCSDPVSIPADSVAVKQCEIFRTNETIPGFDTIGNPMAKGRLYHSLALLLPDGRVLAAGGDTPDDFASKDNYELFYAPELLEADADTARVKLSRPEIGSVSPETITYAATDTLTITMTNGAFDWQEDTCSVVLIRPSAVTHANNMTQRLVTLEAAIVQDNVIKATLAAGPTEAPAVAPPGPYMLFVMDATGCWSEAKWVGLTNSPILPPLPEGDEWSGTVSMQQDVTIACTDTLTIRRGTTVNVSPSEVPLSLIVEGTLVLKGTNANPSRFQCSSLENEQWYGIRLRESGKIVFAPQGGVNGANGTVVEDAMSPIAYEGGDLPDSVAHFFDIRVSAATNNDFAVTFDRDYIVAEGDTLALDPGWRLGFESSDFSKFGRDPNRIELIVHGTLKAPGTSTSPIVFESMQDSTVTGWYGVRLLDTEDVSISDLEYVDFRDTFYAVSLDTLSGNIKNCVFEGLASSPGDIYLERDTRLVSGREWKFTSPAVFKISAFSTLQPSWGVDSTRNEIVLDGVLRVENDATLTLESAAGNPAAGDWYGIRVADVAGFTDDVDLDEAEDVTIRHARGAFVLENTDQLWPDLVALASVVTFVDNVRDVAVAGDRVIGGAASPTSLLTVPAGMKIGATANKDNVSIPGEKATSLVELVIRAGGQVLAQGTPDSSISFGSDDPVPTTLDWYGIRVKLDAVLSSGYGYCESAYSKFEHVEVSDAKFGFHLEGQDTTVCAPTLDHVTFSNIELSNPLDGVPRHIYVDSTDVHIPYGFYDSAVDSFVESRATWDLEAPTYVVFADGIQAKRDSGDLGHEGKEDLFVHGLLVTRPDASGDSLVVFRPVTQHNATGDDWGGIWVDWTGYGTRIDYADVGYAINPLFFSGPDSCFVRHSKIHHYRDDAIWIETAYFDGITIDSCQVLRGAGLGADWGLSAIRAVTSAPLVIRGNLIYDYDLKGNGWNQSTVEGAAIVLVNGKTWCNANPTGTQEVLIEGNDLVGPGEAYTQAPRTALDLVWPCGVPNRTVTVKQNAIVEWSGAAIDMVQGIDVQVECNLIQNNRDGFLYSRTAEPSEPETRLKENYFLSSEDRTIETDTRELLALGPDASDRGKNKIEIDDDPPSGTQYYVHNDATSGDSLDARGNQWVQGETPETSADSVRAHISGDKTVRAGGLITGSYGISCVPAPPDSSPPSGTYRPPRIAVIGGDSGGREADDTVALARPLRTGLERVVPSPFRGTTSVRFTVAEEFPVPVSLSVYDVTGRLVGRLVEGTQPSGWYEVAWNGRDRAGVRVAAGVYFLRLEAGRVRETKKIVYLN